MSTVTFHKVDETKVRLDSNDSGAMMELHEHFSFYVDGYKFMPAYRNKTWNGKIYLFDSRSRCLPYGLIPEAIKFLKSRDYSVKIDESCRSTVTHSKEEFIEDALRRDIRFRGEKIKPYDYQLDAYVHALSEKRSLVISPTGSGKSLIIYLMTRWYLENHDDKVLIVVPTTSLVHQMTKDFAEYSSHDDSFDTDDYVSQIMSGYDKNPKKKKIKITLEDNTVRTFYPNQKVLTSNRGEICAKDLLLTDELL